VCKKGILTAFKDFLKASTTINVLTNIPHLKLIGETFHEETFHGETFQGAPHPHVAN
jgi:hypothetical protein